MESETNTANAVIVALSGCAHAAAGIKRSCGASSAACPERGLPWRRTAAQGTGVIILLSHCCCSCCLNPHDVFLAWTVWDCFLSGADRMANLLCCAQDGRLARQAFNDPERVLLGDALRQLTMKLISQVRGRRAHPSCTHDPVHPAHITPPILHTQLHGRTVLCARARARVCVCVCARAQSHGRTLLCMCVYVCVCAQTHNILCPVHHGAHRAGVHGLSILHMPTSTHSFCTRLSCTHGRTMHVVVFACVCVCACVCMCVHVCVCVCAWLHKQARSSHAVGALGSASLTLPTPASAGCSPPHRSPVDIHRSCRLWQQGSPLCSSGCPSLLQQSQRYPGKSRSHSRSTPPAINPT